MNSGSPPPRVLIPSGSPLLETVAVAIAAGLAHDRTSTHPPSVVSGSSLEDCASDSGPFVFVGWQGNLEESRRLASGILRALARAASGPRSIALFEAGPGNPRSGALEPGDGASRECHGLRFLGPTERFEVAPDSEPHRLSDGELVRAQVWAARVYAEWRESPVEPSEGLPARSPAEDLPAWMTWCGAFD